MNDFLNLAQQLRDIAEDEEIEFSDDNFNTLMNAADELERLEDEYQGLIEAYDKALEDLSVAREMVEELRGNDR